MHLRETLTPTEYRDWTLHYKQTGFVPSALRSALARNTHASLAAVAGSDKIGKMTDFLDPPLTADERALRDERSREDALDAAERGLGI